MFRYRSNYLQIIWSFAIYLKINRKVAIYLKMGAGTLIHFLGALTLIHFLGALTLIHFLGALTRSLRPLRSKDICDLSIYRQMF